jgi:hypothetical protein
MTFDQETGFGYQMPEPPYTGRNRRIAYRRGFDRCILLPNAQRAEDGWIWCNPYRRIGQKIAFREGWDEAYRQLQSGKGAKST